MAPIGRIKTEMKSNWLFKIWHIFVIVGSNWRIIDGRNQTETETAILIIKLRII